MARGADLLERAQQLRAKIVTQDNNYDLPGYKQLLDDLRGLSANQEIAAVYEELVAAFPTAVTIWSRYVEALMSAGQTDDVKTVFGRCLMQCPSVDLWFMYLKFIKKANEPRGAEGIMETKQAYEFTLDTIGQDIHSGPLWQEYINFLSAPKQGSTAYQVLWATGMVGGQEESTKTAALRRTYQRAIVVPTHSLELIWKNYEGFENGVATAHSAAGGSAAAAARQFSSRVIQEQRPRFNAARMAYRERKRKMEGIDSGALPVPPGKGGPSQLEQVKLWKGFLDYERSNPQRLDATALTQRVELAYMQALMCLLHFPEVWYDYARWQADSGGGVGAATACLQRAVHALPNCLLLFFALADLHEAQGDVAAAKQVYEDMVKQLEVDPAALQQQAAAREANPAAAAALPPLPPLGGPIADLPSDQAALVWIQYMRFSRRSESVTASRKLFLRARKAPACPWQVFVASALMEWRHARQAEVARKIFEKGLEVAEFATVPEYVLAYAAFLCDIGDTTNARVLYERVLTEDANRKCTKLWEHYLAFEFEVGDLQTALRLEKRAREALGEAPGAPAGGGASARNIQLLLLRYQFNDSLPCAPGQRVYLEYLMGRGPAPPGFEKQQQPRSSRGSGGGREAAGAGGERDGDHGGDRDERWERGPPPPHHHHYHDDDRRGGRGGGGGGPRLHPILDRFLSELPAPQYMDGPLPDLNLVVDALMEVDQFVPADLEGLAPPAPHSHMAEGAGSSMVGGGGPVGGSVKREYEAGPGGGGADDVDMMYGGGPGKDVYRQRARQRAKMEGCTSSRLSGMGPDTQANLLSSLAVWNAKLSPAWIAMFQLLCVKQAEEGSMQAEQLEQVLVALSSLGATPSSALTQLYYDASLPLLPKTSADSIAAILRALQDAKLQPDVTWLEAVVAAVRGNIQQYSILQLNGVAKALTEFEAGGLRKPFLQNFVAYLKEFFLY